ncbi:MAG: hypothetical protein HKP25_15795 [Marinicaulis sp.]|nr:hypothetical protein [Marinicaulis sp.]
MRETFLGLAALCAFAFSSSATAEEFKLSVQETDEVRVLYSGIAQENRIPHINGTLINAMRFQKELFDWEPWEKPTVLLMDLSDYGNGAAFSSPINGIHLEMAPVSRTFESFVAAERMYSLINHETVHVAALDVWNERDAFWRKVFFGKPMPDRAHPITILYNFLATPRVNAPRWYHEGSAVFLETWMAGGVGRAQGAYDEMVFRAMVRDDAHFYGPLGLVSKGTAVDFRGMANAYLYGTRFFSYLSIAYGPDTVVEWLGRGPDSKAYYSSQFKHVFGKSLNEAWADWIAFEHDFQAKNLERIRIHPITERETLSNEALGSISRAFFNAERGTLLAAYRFPGVVEMVGELDINDGGIRRLTDVKGSMPHRVSSVAYDPESKTAWYTTDNLAHRDIVQLDVETGKKNVLLRDIRIGDLVFNRADRSLWGVRHLNTVSSLVRIEPPYGKENWKLIHQADFGEDMFDLDISPDGTLMAMTQGTVSGQQTLKVLRIDDLLENKFDPIATFHIPNKQPEGAAFSPDGKHVYFSSYITNVSNIFRLNIDTEEWQALSNTETGLVRPIPQADGSVIAFEFTGEGFTPVRLEGEPITSIEAIQYLGYELKQKRPEMAQFAAGNAKDNVDLAKEAPVNSVYKPSRRLRLGSIYPIIEGYKGEVGFGIHVNFEDPAYFNQVDVTLSWSPSDTLMGDEKFHADLSYKGLNWRARYWHNDADFYDLFGPTKRARKGDAFILGYEKALIYDDPRVLRIGGEVGYYSGLDTLPQNQNVGTTFTELLATEFMLSYTNTQDSLGSVDHEKGWRWDLHANVDRAGGDTIGRVHGGIDFGFALPIKNSSVWFYNSGGFAEGNDLNPLSSFYFGGFKNNYVDDREVKRYREYHTLPGFEIDEIAGREFAKSIAEWNLPPYRFESIGTPSLFLANARTAIFGGALWANPAFAPDRVLYTLGGQVDFNFTLAHRLPMTLSIGYASGFESGEARNDEFLISLKIM